MRLASSVRDSLGIPVARPEGSQHPEDLRGTAFMAERHEAWLRAAGAAQVWQFRLDQRMLSGGQHQAGTARMSDSPAHGATDTNGKVSGNRPDLRRRRQRPRDQRRGQPGAHDHGDRVAHCGPARQIMSVCLTRYFDTAHSIGQAPRWTSANCLTIDSIQSTIRDRACR